MLNATDIHVTLGAHIILRGVDFTAAPGKLTAIVGPNGSGKTTLLRAMTGDVTYDGIVTLDGDDTAKLRQWDLAARRAVLPQASTLAFPFTVIEVVRIGQHQGMTRQADQIALAALARVGLSHFADRFYQELSGGEQQRVQLARVLSQVWEPVQNEIPKWLLLDEPVSSLDIGHQLEVMEITRDFARRGGGVVAVMHDLNLTALYADAVTMMCNGAVLASGSPEQVLTDGILSTAYGCRIEVGKTPAPGTPFVLPHAATLSAVERQAS